MEQDKVDLEAEKFEENQGRKKQKRQVQWGPIQRIARPRRYHEDDKTILQRAQELKEYKNLCKGTKPTLISAFESHDSLTDKAKCVNISLGSTAELIKSNVDLFVTKDLDGRRDFVDKNPEVNLPVNLDTDLNLENFPNLENQSSTLLPSPLKEKGKDVENSWVKVTSKGLKTSKTTDVYQ